MSQTSRYEAGKKAYTRNRELTPQADALLWAIAAMIEHRPPKKKTDKPKLPFTLGHFHGRILSECSDVVNVASYSNRDFGRLGKILAEIRPAVTAKDIDLLIDFLNDGGLSWWTGTTKPTLPSLIKMLDKLIHQAREHRTVNHTTESAIR